MREIYIDDSTQHINIGKECENDALAVYFPKQYYTETFGDGGTFMLLVKRPGDTEVPYFVELDTESKPGYVTWIVGNPDVAIEGYGTCELHYIIGDTLAKSFTYATLINPALGEGGDAPDPSQGWLESFYEAFDEVKEAVAVAPEIANLTAQATEAAENANAALVAAQAAQAECENIAVVGGYTRTEMDAMLAAKQDDLTFDDTPTDGSDNPVKSGGVYSTVASLGSSVNTAMANLASDIEDELTQIEQSTEAALANKSNTGHTHTAGDVTSGVFPVARGGTGANTAADALTILGAAPVVHTHAAGDIASGTIPIARGGTGATTAADARTALGAQATLTFDDAPTSGSNNPVKSNGIYAAIQNAGGGVIDTAMNASSNNAVQNRVITAALANKSDTGHTHDAANIASGTLAVARGGTGANTASGALTNLGAAAASHTHNAENITSGILAIARGGTGNAYGYVRAGLKSGVTAGNCATAEGYNSSATGDYSHVEGSDCIAIGTSSHAEGVTCQSNADGAHSEGYMCEARKMYAHAEGYRTISSGNFSHSECAYSIASGYASHAEGYNCRSSGNSSHAEGANCTVSGNYSHAEGHGCNVSGTYSHAEGINCAASGIESHAEGGWCVACGTCSHAGGFHTNAAAYYQTAIGSYNVVYAGSSGANSSAYFIVGKGFEESIRANCFRVATTAVYGAGAYNSSGADYAELFEWQDGNPDAEDRAGLFATLDGAQIRLVTSNDDFVLGIVSGNPSVVGDVFDDQWAGMYVTDVFGRPVWEDVDVPAEYDDDGNEITPAHTETRQKLNPAYDHTKKYQARTERPEWDAVGIMGKLVARDDGTCQINGWAKPGPGAMATHSDTQTKYRVMERLDDSHIRVLIL